MKKGRISEARRWLQQARHDLQAARWNLEGGFYNTVCFLAQQSGEKALKSILYFLGARRKALLTHSLLEMSKEAAKTIIPFTDLVEEARWLDLHYIPSRYPNGLPSGYPHLFYSKSMADEAIRSAEKILSSVLAFYEKEGATQILASAEE